MEVSMIKAFIFLVVAGFSSSTLASGCDSNFFRSGGIIGQKVIQDFGQLTVSDAQKIIESMKQAHKTALHYWNKLPVPNSPSKIKIITTSYIGLDTDCGWSKFGSTLTITHLEIESKDGLFYYPDVYKDIYPEDLDEDKYIEIKPKQGSILTDKELK